MNFELLKNYGVNIEESINFLGSVEMYNEILSDFLGAISEKLNNIKIYKELKDMNNYAILVHSLKSDSKYLGFSKLAELAYQHEMASKQNNSDWVTEHYNELIVEAVRIVSVMKKYSEEGSKNTSNSNKTILVADDSNIIRNFVAKIFQDEYEVLTAVDGNEAIKIIENSNNIACLLLDLNMPNCDGFEVLEYLKSNNLFNNVPVSLITGDDTKQSIDKAFKYPIVDMINKPFSESSLRKIVEKTISFYN